MAITTESENLDVNQGLIIEQFGELKATPYFEDYMFNLVADINNLNLLAAGPAYGIWNGDAGQIVAQVPTEEVNILGGVGISTAVVEGAPDVLTIINDDPFPEAPNDGQPYGRQSLNWVDLDSLYIPDAPIDGSPYGRLNAAWTNLDSLFIPIGGAGEVTNLTLTGFFGTILNLFQTTGASPISIDLAAALGLSSLQTLYLVAPSVPQITVNAVVEPLTIDASVAGDVFAVRDEVNADILRASTVDLEINKHTHFTYSTFVPGQPQFNMLWNPTAAITGNYIGGALSVAFDFTVTTGVYIPATFSDTSISRIAAVPGFSAFTFINELAQITNSGNFNLPSALVMNIGLTHQRNSVGTSTTPGTTGISFSPQTRATIAGAVMTKTIQTAVRCSPTFSTVAGSTVNLGTITGLALFQPAGALFQPQAGTENMTAYLGVDFPNMTFGGAAAVINVVRSALNSGTNKRFLNHTGNAVSTHRGQFIQDVDIVGRTLGAGSDWQDGWGAAGFYFMQFNALAGQLRFSNPIANQFVIAPNVVNDQLDLQFRLLHSGDQLGFYGTPTIAQQLAVPITIAAVHAALVALGLIT